MNIMYLCDDNYASIAGVSILSLLDHNKEIEDINIFLIEDAISEENKRKLREIVHKFNRKIEFIHKPNIKKLLGHEVELHWWTENVFSRVFLSEIFKNYLDIQRLLYIDCDTLIVGPLKDLWELELGNYLGAGVCEAMGNLHKKAIGLEKEDNYFNAGMFLIDLQKWREEELDKKASEFVQDVRGKMEYADESVLNGILSKRILPLPPKYNLTSLSIYFSVKEVKRYRKPYKYYSEQERTESLNDPRVIHFTSTYVDCRPWITGSRHPYKDEWMSYKGISPWKYQELLKESRSKSKLIGRQLAMFLPRSMRIEVTGFIHAYVKPLKYVGSKDS